MECMELIEQKIETLFSETTKTVTTFDESVNSYLDKVLELQGYINYIREMTEDAAEMLYGYSRSMTVDEYLTVKPLLKDAGSSLSKLYIRVRNMKSFYKAAKTCVNEFHHSVQHFNEIASDLELFKVELNQDKEYQDLVSVVNSL
ncbi:MAG: hypothetical protein LBQ73_04570 [Tannerellaceae bacterium]|nr:hypothetical protein [Tannerellaceae bacterium]